MIRDKHFRAVHGTGSTLAICLVLASCAVHPIATGHPDRPAPIDLSLASITARIGASSDRELSGLRRTPPDQLRRAFILIKTDRTDQALGVLNLLLQDRALSHSNRARSIALYLRSRIFVLRSDRPRAIEDCRAARRLAASPELRRWCDADLARWQPPAPNPKKRPRAASGKLAIERRSQWKAGRPDRRHLSPMGTVNRLTIHHSAVLCRIGNKKLIATHIRAIQIEHKKRPHWGDIGYHFLIDPVGRIWQGRELRYQGAHSGGTNNEHNIGICLLGCFVGKRGGQNPPPKQVRAMERLVSYLSAKHSIRPSHIHTHRELKSDTVCPGARLQAIVKRMRTRRSVAAADQRRSIAVGGSR